jgi:hypothetical protein
MLITLPVVGEDPQTKRNSQPHPQPLQQLETWHRGDLFHLWVVPFGRASPSFWEEMIWNPPQQSFGKIVMMTGKKNAAHEQSLLEGDTPVIASTLAVTASL